MKKHPIRSLSFAGVKKLKQKKGESLIETMGALLIMTMGFLILPGAIIASGKLDRSVEDLVISAEKDPETGRYGTILEEPIGLRFEYQGVSTEPVDPLQLSVPVIRYGNEEKALYEYSLHAEEEEHDEIGNQD